MRHDLQPTSHAQPPRAAQLAAILTLIALTVLGLWLRLYGLTGWDGTLSVDESRLAMAARGILDTGLPRLPSGWIYTRGLLATYLTAPSLALLGPTDFAARLPAVLAGTAAIPVGYLLGREVAGRPGGLFVASFLVGHSSFLVWSRQAWFYALYVLLFAAALLFILRAHRSGQTRDQLLAGCTVGLSMFAHEAGAFLLAPLAMQILLRLRVAKQRPGGRAVPLASLAIVVVSAALLWLLVTRLRAESLVGAYGEIDEYLSLAFEWSRVRFYLRLLADGPGLFLLAALIGLPLAIWRRQASTLLLWLALLPSFLHAAFLIPRGPQERYGLTLIVVIAVLAAQGVRLLAEYVLPRLRDRYRRWMPSQGVVVGIVFGAMLLAHQDVMQAVSRAQLSPRDGAWLRQVRELGLGPDDIVMTDVPTVVGWYVGGLDYWVSSRDFEKYTTRTDALRRDVHTGAVLIRNRSELERLVFDRHRAETVWMVASGRNYQWGELVDDDLKTALDRGASQRLNSGDNFRVLVLRVPPGS